MKRSIQVTLLIAVTFVGLAVFRATADEPADKPQPKLIQAKQPQLIAAKLSRRFGNLLQKGQNVTLYQFSQEALYQVRIVSDDQRKQIEAVVERSRKELADLQSKISDLDKRRQDAADNAMRAELRDERERLRVSYQPAPLPVDVRSAKFYLISDVGSDYVGFERNGVETFHRLSSIHRIISGVEIDDE